MFKRKTKILVIDPSFVHYKGNEKRLKALKEKGWVIIVAPTGAIRVLEVKK